MKENIGHLRQSYERGSLRKADVKNNPMQLFRQWFSEALEDDLVAEANAMSLSTLGFDGFPRSRVVLLKAYNEDGFIFYTNYQSEKGESIAKHPKVGLHFFWPSLERQIHIKGTAEKIAAEVSDQYFQSRPIGSQLGATLSPQSSAIPNRTWLEDELKRMEIQTQDKALTRPSHWGGYLVRPAEIEFWQGRPNRLHDRIRCRLQKWDWIVERLAP